MSTSTEALAKRALAALQHWPADPLRPKAQLGSTLAARLSRTPPQFPGRSTDEHNAVQQVAAIVALLENRYSTQHYPLPTRSAPVPRGTTSMSLLSPDEAAAAVEAGLSLCGGIMTPRGDPEYYDKLRAALVDIPKMTYWQGVMMRIKGLVRRE